MVISAFSRFIGLFDMNSYQYLSIRLAMDLDGVVRSLKIVANTHRASILRVLHGGDGGRFAENDTTIENS